MKVLLFSDHDELRGRMLFSLEGQAGARVTEAKTLEEAMSALREPGWELVVYAMGEGRLPAEHRPFWEAAASVPTVVAAPESVRDDAHALTRSLVALLPPETAVRDVVEVVQRLVDRGQFARERPDHGFCRIGTGLLIALSPLQADVYIRLAQDKFLRLLKAGDEFNTRDLEKYRDHKGIEHLWIEAADLAHFVGRLEEEMKKQVVKAPHDLPGSARMILSSQATVQELIAHMGVTPEVQRIARLQVETSLRSMRQDWKISRLMEQLKQEGGFIAYHSLLLAYISCMIAQRTPLAGEYTAYKLTFAAFLHDMALKNQELATLDSLADLERRRKEFTDKDASDFRLHPARAAELCREFKEVPFDVETIVIQHHERPDGAGFPRGLSSSKINPLAAVMIVAHELIYFMRNAGKSFRMDDFVACMQPYYTGEFGQILKAIRFDD